MRRVTEDLGSVTVATLSFIWPGLGHWAAGRRRRGVILGLFTLLLALVGAGWLLGRRRSDLLAWSVTPSWLTAAIVASGLTLGYRGWVAYDAFRGQRRRRGYQGRPPLAHLAMLTVITIAASVPHLVVARYAAAQLELLDEVFDAQSTQTARPTALPMSTTTPDTAQPASTDEPTPDAALDTPPISPSAPPPPFPDLTAPATASATWDGDERLTILLLGGDGGFDRRGVRTDTIMALSIEVASGDAVLFSIPRNWQRMPFPGGTPAERQWPDGYPSIANEIYGAGVGNPLLFPGTDDPGGMAIKSSVAQLLGLPVHYYALVDMVGVAETIDLFGGVDVTVTEWIDDSIKPITPGGPSLVISTRPGEYHFDGLTALAYMRARRTSSDYHRMSRQRCVVGALIDQVGVGPVLTNYTELTDIIETHLTTDIPLDRLPELLEIADRLDLDRIVTVNFIPPDWPRGAAPVADVRAAVTRALATDVAPSASLDTACGA